MGEEVEEVYAAGGVLVDPAFKAEDDLDTALVVLHFRSGAIGTIDNSRKAVFGYDQRVEILGSKGKIASENRYPNQVVVSGEKYVYTDLPLNFFMQRYTESFALELQVFVQAVLEGKPTPVTGADSRVPVVMALAARKSYDEHRPVRLEGGHRREAIETDLHPDRRSSLGAGGGADPGNYAADDLEVSA